MEKKDTAHTVYQQIRRVSVLGIMVVIILATGAGLWLNPNQEQRIRDNTLTAAVQAVSYTLTLTDGDDIQSDVKYVDQIVHGIPSIDLFAIYHADGTPAYFCDISADQDTGGTLPVLEEELMSRLAAASSPILDSSQTPLGADYCAYAAVHSDDGTVSGYVMAGLYLKSIRNTSLHTLGVFLLIGIAPLSVGSFLSLQLSRRIKSNLLGYEPDAFCNLFLNRMELLDALDEGLLAIDQDEHIIYLNRAAAEMLSLDKSAVLGKSLPKVYPQSTISRVLRTRQPEYNISLKSLHHVHILSDRMPVFRNGQIVGAVAIFRNRTEVVNLARELTGVQHIVEAMRAYTHEFMNKLHVILGLLQLGEAKRAEEYVLQLTQTRAMSVERISRRISEPSVAALLIGKSCRAAELGVRLTLDPKSCLSAENHYLPTSGMITIPGNLIENAFDAFADTPSDTLHEMVVSVREGPKGLILSVDDNARGMSEEVQKQIFARGTTTKGEGHGTGLFLVKMWWIPTTGRSGWSPHRTWAVPSSLHSARRRNLQSRKRSELRCAALSLWKMIR